MNKFFILILLFSQHIIFSQSVEINEIMSSNTKTLYDEDGDASDWIELYNGGSNQISITGYYLSDDSLNIKKWQFGNAIIQPEEHMIVFASDKNKKMNYWHTNFKLSASGETVILSDSNGSIVDRVDLPVLSPDVSYARISDGSHSWMIQVPSPGSANTGEEIKPYADTISVSLPGGFYPSTISVELSARESRIFYTLDGSDPDSNKTKYSAPIRIQKTSVLRAVSLLENHLPGPVITNTYFINEATDLPVISLSSDPYNLFDYNYGIYADGPGWTSADPHFGANYWMDWERPAHIEFFEDNKSPGFSENCGIAIYGAWSRAYPQKSFAVKFKDEYGADKIEYPLFPGFNITTFKSFVLRNSGNDFYYTHLRDAMMQTLVKDLDIDYLEYRPAKAFINGQYWGIYNIREKINEHYVANRYGVDPDSIDMLEDNMEVIHGDSLHYLQLIDYISTHDMSTASAYDYVNSMIDLDECILYFAAQAYYDNRDWPGNNIKYWRERSENGKWRWILFDLDFGFSLYGHGPWEDHIAFMFATNGPSWPNPPWSTLLQRKLVANPTIRNQFINQIADLLNTNFKSTRVVEVINNLANHIGSEITKHRSKWGIAGESLDKMISFANERPAYLRDHVRNYFHCGSDGNITVNSTEGGIIKLNTLSLKPTDVPWTGVYFQGNIVHLKAVAAPGYKFDGWRGAVTSKNDTLSLSVGSNTSIFASFSVDTSSVKEIVINEINYNSSEDFESGDWIELYNRSDQPVDISDWYYSDSDENHKFIIPPGTTLEPDSYLVLVDNDSAFSAQFPDVKNFIGETGFGLSGSGEFMKLVNGEGQIIDSLTYDDQLPWPTEADGLGATLELVDASSDNSQAENWKASTGHGTPGAQNSAVTSTKEIESVLLPSEFSLSQNYPNPFNPATVINYQVPIPSYISLKIYNLLGQEVATLFEGVRQPGGYNVIFDGSGLSNGVYLYRMTAQDFIETKKLILLK